MHLKLTIFLPRFQCLRISPDLKRGILSMGEYFSKSEFRRFHLKIVGVQRNLEHETSPRALFTVPRV